MSFWRNSWVGVMDKFVFCQVYNPYRHDSKIESSTYSIPAVTLKEKSVDNAENARN